MFYPYIKEAGLIWMLPIVFLSFCALAFCLERSWYWLRQYIFSMTRSKTLEKIYEQPLDVEKIIRHCRNHHDAVIMTLHEFIIQYNEVALEIAERKARLFGEHQLEKSRRFLDILSFISSIAGSLGLMGTVVGISLSFKTLAQEDSQGIALSLSTVMYTTIGGIVLFLLSYLFFFFFQKFSDHLEIVMETNLQKLKDMLEIEQKSRLVFADTGKEQEVVVHTSEEEDCQIIRDFSCRENEQEEQQEDNSSAEQPETASQEKIL